MITDRCILEYKEIFVKNMKESKLICDEDHNQYLKIYEQVVEELEHPHLFIFLKSDLETNIARIKRRARDCEKEIDEKYLINLSQRYEEFLRLLNQDE